MYSKHKSGSLAELKVSQYFLENDYEIFFPITRSVIDFIAVKGEEIVRVQVKSAYFMQRENGSSYIQATTRRNGSKYVDTLYEKNNFDIMAITYEDKLWLFPYEDVKHLQSIVLEKGQQIRRGNKYNFDPSPYRIF